MDFINERMGDVLYSGFKGISDELKEAIIRSYKETGDANKTLEKFRKDIVFEAWTSYIDEKSVGALDVIAPIGAMFLPKLSNYLNDKIMKQMPGANVGDNFSASMGISLFSSKTPEALFREIAGKEWTEGKLEELAYMLAAYQDADKDEYSFYTPQYFQVQEQQRIQNLSNSSNNRPVSKKTSPADIKAWIDKRGANFIKQYIRDQIPAEYGMSQLSDGGLFGWGDNVEGDIIKGYEFNAYVDLDRQALELWQKHEGDIWLNILKRLVDKKNDYSKAFITSQDSGKKYSDDEQRRIIDIRNVLAHVERLKEANGKDKKPSYFIHYKEKDIDSIMKDAQKVLDKSSKSIDKIMTLNGEKIEEFLSALGKEESLSLSRDEIKRIRKDGASILAAERYSVKNAVEVYMSRKTSEESKVNPEAIMQYMRVFLASQISDEFQISETLREKMLDFLSRNLSNPENAAKSDWQLASMLMKEFSRDISVEVMREYQNERIVKFKDVFLPALISAGSLVPFGIGNYVRLIAQSAEAIPGLEGISGQRLINKINNSGYVVTDTEKNKILVLNTLSESQGFHLYNAKDEEDAQKWFDKNERKQLEKSLKSYVERDLGISGLIEVKNLGGLLEGYKHNQTEDSAKTFNDWLAANKDRIYLQALNQILKKAPSSKDLSIFNAMMRAKKYFQTTYPDGNYPQDLAPSIEEAVGKADGIIAKRTDVVAYKLKVLKIELAKIGIKKDDKTLTLELSKSKHYMEVAAVIAALKAENTAVVAAPVSPVLQLQPEEKAAPQRKEQLSNEDVRQIASEFMQGNSLPKSFIDAVDFTDAQRNMVDNGTVVYDAAVLLKALALYPSQNRDLIKKMLDSLSNGNVKAGGRFVFDSGATGKFVYKTLSVNPSANDGNFAVEYFPGTGENAWLGAAAASLVEAYKDDEPLRAQAMELLTGIAEGIIELQTKEGLIRMAPKDSERDYYPGANFYNIASTENNISCIPVLRYMAKHADNDAAKAKYASALESLTNAIFLLYDKDLGYFITGIDDLTAANDEKKENKAFATDCQTWLILAFGPQEVDKRLGEGASAKLLKKALDIAGVKTSGQYTGLDFSSRKEVVSFEWTLGWSAAAKLVLAEGKDVQLQDALNSITKYMRSSENKKGLLKYMDSDKPVPTGFGWDALVAMSLASSSWGIFDNLGLNPFEIYSDTPSLPQTVEKSQEEAQPKKTTDYDTQRKEDFIKRLNDAGVPSQFYSEITVASSLVLYFQSLRSDDIDINPSELSLLRVLSAMLAYEVEGFDAYLDKLGSLGGFEIKDLQNMPIYLPSFAVGEIKDAYDSVKQYNTDNSEKLAGLSGKFQTLKSHLNLFHLEINAEISNNLGTGRVPVLKNASREMIRLQRQILLIEREIARLQASLISNPSESPSYSDLTKLISNLNDIAVRQSEEDAQRASQDMFPKISGMDLKSISEDYDAAVSSLSKFLIGQGLIPDDASRYKSFADPLLRLDIVRDFVLDKKAKGEQFDQNYWASQASKKFMRRILLDTLNQEEKLLKYENKGNVVNYEAMGLRSAYLRRLANADGSELTQQEKAALYAVDVRLKTFIEARDSEMPVILGVLSGYRADMRSKSLTDAMPAGFVHLSRDLQISMMKEYYALYLNQLLSNGMDRNRVDSGHIRDSLLRKYGFDIVFDFVAFETDKLDKGGKVDAALVGKWIEMLNNNMELRKKSGLANQTGKKYGFTHYDDIIMDSVERFVKIVLNNETISEDEKARYMEMALAGIKSEDDKVEFLFRTIEDRFKGHDKSVLAAVREYLKVVVHAQSNYNIVATGKDGVERKLGSISMGAFTDFVNWSVNLTGSADIEQIIKHIKSKADDLKNSQMVDYQINRAFEAAAADAIKKTLGVYLPDAFKWTDISVDLSNTIINALRKVIDADTMKEIEDKVKAIALDPKKKDEQKTAEIRKLINQILTEKGQTGNDPLVDLAIGVVNDWRGDILFSALDTYMRDGEIALADFKEIAGNIYFGIGKVWEDETDRQRKDSIVTRFENSLNEIMKHRKGNLNDTQWNDEYVVFFREKFAHSEYEPDVPPTFDNPEDVPSDTTEVTEVPDNPDIVQDSELVGFRDSILTNPYWLARFNEWYMEGADLADLTPDEQIEKVKLALAVDTDGNGDFDKPLSAADSEAVFIRMVELYDAIKNGYKTEFFNKYQIDIEDPAFGRTIKRILTDLLFDSNKNMISVQGAIKEIRFRLELDSLWAFLKANPQRIALVNFLYRDPNTGVGVIDQIESADTPEAVDAGKYNWMPTLLYLDTNGDGTVDKTVSVDTAMNNFVRQEALYNKIMNDPDRKGMVAEMYNAFNGKDINDRDQYGISNWLHAVNMLLFDSAGKMKSEVNILSDIDHMVKSKKDLEKGCQALTGDYRISLSAENTIPYFKVEITVRGQKYTTDVYPFKDASGNIPAGKDSRVVDNTIYVMQIFAGLVNRGFIVETIINTSDHSQDHFLVSKPGLGLIETSTGNIISREVWPFAGPNRQNYQMAEQMNRLFEAMKGLQNRGYKIYKVDETTYTLERDGKKYTVYPYKNGVSPLDGIKTADEMLKELEGLNGMDNFYT
ncbi:MAG: hypothetical protein LBU09_03090, partial [Endomicrobium sp.]|nr:hypothetical protein [Endomicrobium sp.]